MSGQVSGSSASSVSGAVLGVLLGGVLLRFIWTALGLRRLRTYRTQACPPLQESASIREARSLTGSRVAVYISAKLRSPATFGALSPAILLPQRFFELPASQQKAIACHEFLHVTWHDWAWTVAEELALTVLWFHPAVWWTVRNIRLSREQTVDAEVIRITASRHAYLDALLAIAERSFESLAAPLFFIESRLAQRVALILKETKMSSSRVVASLFAATVILCLAGAVSVWSFPLSTPASTPPPALSGEPQSSSMPSDSVYGYQGGSDEIGGRIYKVGKNVSAPMPIHDPEPAYTRSARKAKLLGTAVFAVVVDTKGNVHDVKETSKPLGLGLDESAMKTLQTWKFTPAMRNHMPVAVRVTVEVTFRLT